MEVKVGLGDICKATQDLMNFPALVSKCALDSFYHSQSHLLHQNRNQRLKVLMRGLETIQVDVIDVKEGLNLVRVPAVEDQLAQYSLLLLSSQCGGVTDPISRYFTETQKVRLTYRLWWRSVCLLRSNTRQRENSPPPAVGRLEECSHSSNTPLTRLSQHESKATVTHFVSR